MKNNNLYTKIYLSLLTLAVIAGIASYSGGAFTQKENSPNAPNGEKILTTPERKLIKNPANAPSKPLISPTTDKTVLLPSPPFNGTTTQATTPPPIQAISPVAGEKAAKRFLKGIKDSLELGGEAKITVSGGSLLWKTKEISITTLDSAALPKMDFGLTNVTDAREGYRFLPHGVHFDENNKAQLSLGYDRTKIPSGYTEEDIRTYYYDSRTRHWAALERVSIDREKHKIISRTTHFTDMINGVLQAPESPETQGFAPTQFSGMQAADPTSKIQIISPPSANNRGSANVSYALEMPPARNGMQPGLSVSYNSDGSGGWLGEGWDLSLPSISIDTRWGVPRYDDKKETETYSFNGSMLAAQDDKGESSVAHRGEKLNRKAERQFYLRNEGSFSRIIRKGDNPSNYTWEVTDKSGVKYTYGTNGGILKGTAQTLTGGKEVAAEWKLSRVEELHGDWIEYIYESIDETIKGDLKAAALYLKEVRAGNKGQQAHTVVTFDSHSKKTKQSFSGRYGFLTSNHKLLDKVTINFEGKPLRSYGFTYEEGSFLTERLQSLTHYDDTGKAFARHKMDYYDDVKTGGNYLPFKPEETWNTHDDGINGGLINPLSLLKTGIFSASATALGLSKGISAGGSIYAGVGPGSNVTSKANTGGASFGYNYSENVGISTLVDINGDGIADKVYKQGGSLYFRAGSAEGTFGNPLPVSGISEFSKSHTNTTTTGVLIHPLSVVAGNSSQNSKTSINYYFSDVNGDGLVDLVAGGKVYFNHIEFDSQGNALPTFTANSTDTPSPIRGGGVIDDSDTKVDPQEQAEFLSDNPLQDAVRVWVAPYDGTVAISGTAKLLPPEGNYDSSAYEKADGVRLALQVKAKEIKYLNISKGDFAAKDMSAEKIDIVKGDKIYFRVQSGAQENANGDFDQVEWSPEITYKDSSEDPNGYTQAYKAEEGYVLGDEGILVVPVKDKYSITSSFVKPITSDSLTLKILLGDNKIIYEKTFADQDVFNGEINIPVVDNSQIQAESFQFVIQSSSNIAWEKIHWTPTVSYSETADGAVYPMKTSASVKLDGIYGQVFSQGTSQTVQKAGEGSLKLTVDLIKPEQKEKANGGFTLTVKALNKILYKGQLTLKDGEITSANNIKVNLTEGKVWVELFSNETKAEDFKGIDFINARITDADKAQSLAPVAVYYKWDDRRFGPLHRSWGQFSYNSMEGRATKAILEGYLKLPENEDDKEDPKTMIYSPMGLGEAKSFWTGLDASVYVKEKIMSASRLGQKDVILENLLAGVSGSVEQGGGNCLTGTGAFGVRKESKSSSSDHMASVSYDGISGTLNTANGNDEILLSFEDMNGDGYPDIISRNQVQMTNTQGGFDGEIVKFKGFAYHKSASTSAAFGTGGNPIHAHSVSSAEAKAEVASAKSVASSAKATKSGAPNNKNTGLYIKAATDKGNAEAALQALGKSKNALAVTPGAGVQLSSDEAVESFTDINGDGLPDKIFKDGKASINLGYGFAPAVAWGLEKIQEGKGTDFNASLGFSKNASSWAGGIGLNSTHTRTEFTLIDVNGDGLVDKVYASSAELMVALNTGNGFAAPVAWGKSENINRSAATGESINAAFTFGFPIPIVSIRVVFNPSVSTGHSVNRPLDDFRDLDGDGYPDLVSSEREESLKVRRSTIGRTNRLKTVTNPLGGKFTLDYARTAATYGHPGGKWALSSVEIDDGIHDDGANIKTSFVYADGVQDRHEREFLGFGKVTVLSLDTEKNSAPYRKTLQTYDVSNYYKAGRLLDSSVQDAQGNTYTETRNSYYNYEVKPLNNDTFDLVENNSLCGDGKISFSPLKYTQTRVYEGKAQGVVANESFYQYKSPGHGELQSYIYSDKGALGEEGKGEYNYTTGIRYTENPAKHIYGLPIAAVTNSSTAGAAYRNVQAVYDLNYANHPTQFRQDLNGQEYAVTDIQYDSYGNITEKTLPANYKGERMTYKYQYENKYNSYLTRIDDNFGYQMFFEDFDYRYAAPLLTKDNNGYSLTTTMDNLGRALSVQGPNEEENGQKYTIKYEYPKELGVSSEELGAIPYAVTKHYDPQHPNEDLETLSFVDGFGRAVQVKKSGVVYDNGTDKQVMLVSGRIKYDPFGRAKETYYPREESGISNEEFSPEFDKVSPTQMQYDILDRALKVTLPDGSVTQNAYTIEGNSFAAATTDALGNKTASFSNGSGLTLKTEIYGSKGTLTTSFAYDDLNQLLSVTDTEGNITASVYDSGGRRLSLAQPDAGTTLFAYDPAGNLLTRQTAQATIKYEYDYNRLTAVVYPDRPQNNVKYYYGGKNADFNRKARLSFIEDATGGQEFKYGKMGEVTEIRRTVIVPNQAIATYVTKWTYDSWNRLTEMVYPDQEKLTYAYNRGGLLESMKGSKAYSYNYVNKIGYDKFEQRVYMKYCNGAETRYPHDPLRNRLSGLKVELAGKKILDNAYAYDAVSNVLSVTNSAQPDGLGGQMTHKYSYDNLYRLTSAAGTYTGTGQKKAGYSLKMSYDNLHNIVSKKQDLSQTNVQFTGNLFAGYNLDYEYSTEHPHQIKTIADNNYRSESGISSEELGVKETQNYTYDANGNLIYVNVERLRDDGKQTEKIKERKLRWDEENRLMAIDDNGFISNYWYDYAGERVVKEAGGNEGVFVNSVFSGGRTDNSTFTLYVSPYMVVSQGGHYTKHYYIGGERVVSKLGDLDSYGADPRRIEYAGEDVDKVVIDYPNKYKDAQQTVKDNYKDFKVPYLGTDNDDYVNGEGFCCTDKSSKMTALDSNIGNGNDDPEKLIFFYHSDHLGSTSYITNLDGNVVQHIEYIPFGEVFIEERNNVWNSPYLFNSKELDEETGLYYYGARYYNPRESVWLSVDPLAEKTGTPYQYCFQNPVNIIDPTGMEGESVKEPPIKRLSFFSDKTGNYFWNESRNAYEHYVYNKEGYTRFTGYYFPNENIGPKGDYTIIEQGKPYELARLDRVEEVKYTDKQPEDFGKYITQEYGYRKQLESKIFAREKGEKDARRIITELKKVPELSKDWAGLKVETMTYEETRAYGTTFNSTTKPVHNDAGKNFLQDLMAEIVNFVTTVKK
jgi:RHS repeat-associated protein